VALGKLDPLHEMKHRKGLISTGTEPE
jgi:hypothetical protein